MPLIDPGSRAPAFTLPDQSGHKHRLTAHKGSPVVLFFYPKDDTSGCTKEACAFRDLSKDFKKAGAVVFGIKTVVTPIEALSKAQRLGLIEAMDRQTDEMRDYHGGADHNDQAVIALRALA